MGCRQMDAEAQNLHERYINVRRRHDKQAYQADVVEPVIMPALNLLAMPHGLRVVKPAEVSCLGGRQLKASCQVNAASKSGWSKGDTKLLKVMQAPHELHLGLLEEDQNDMLMDNAGINVVVKALKDWAAAAVQPTEATRRSTVYASGEKVLYRTFENCRVYFTGQ